MAEDCDCLEFSRREIEIVRLVFQDAPDQAIAAELAISVNTVHTHLKRLYSKLGVTSRAGLILQIVHEHLADLQEAEHPTPTVRLHPGLEKPPDTLSSGVLFSGLIAFPAAFTTFLDLFPAGCHL